MKTLAKVVSIFILLLGLVSFILHVLGIPVNNIKGELIPLGECTCILIIVGLISAGLSFRSK